MEEPGTALELVLPGRLGRLAEAGRAAAPELPISIRPRRALKVEAGTVGSLSPLGPTDASRLRRVLRAELLEPSSHYMQPSWVVTEDAIPGLVISFRYEGQDAHGIAGRIRDLDMAFRRAGATLENYLAGESGLDWTYPIRPNRGGLWVLGSRLGSYEVVATVYGSLVVLAASAPVSLASLVSLAWDSAVGATRVGRWVVRRFEGSPADGPPQLGSSGGDQEWGLKQTKALQPVMLEAARAGNGLEFVNNSTTGEVRLTIYPNTELVVD